MIDFNILSAAGKLVKTPNSLLVGRALKFQRFSMHIFRFKTYPLVKTINPVFYGEEKGP
jgi:hypothetical protein